MKRACSLLAVLVASTFQAAKQKERKEINVTWKNTTPQKKKKNFSPESDTDQNWLL